MSDKKDELGEFLSDLKWRLNDIKDMLMEKGVGGARIYGCDEYSTPVKNLKLALDQIEKLQTEKP
jgi:hypothetical protein